MSTVPLELDGMEAMFLHGAVRDALGKAERDLERLAGAGDFERSIIVASRDHLARVFRKVEDALYPPDDYPADEIAQWPR